MNKLYLRVEGISCDHCESEIEDNLKKINSIKEVTFDGSIVILKYNKSINKTKVKKKLTDLGYAVKEISDKAIKEDIPVFNLIIIALIILILNLLIKKLFGYDFFAVIPVINESISLGMLFIIGLLTSIHCISMCGSINLVASTGATEKIKKPLSYNLGRLISYTLLGGLVGLIGSIFEINKYIQGSIILFASIFMFLYALSMLRILRFNISIFNVRKVKTKNSFVIGLLNGLMPCGPLQAMQLYALSTGSFWLGALSMFLFCLGTIPLMLSMGVFINYLSSKIKSVVVKVTSVLILLLSIIMLNRALLTLGVDVTSIFSDSDNRLKGTLIDGYQVVEFDLDYGHYEDIIVQKDIPVKIIINAEKRYLAGCNNEIIINEYNIRYKLTEGENIIEFTPTKEGIYYYTCWMNMIKNTIKVVDKLNLTECVEEEFVCH